MSIIPQVRNATVLKCATPNDAKRIVKRALRRGWWCLVFTHEHSPHIALSDTIDLELDLRDRLANIDFKVMS